MELLQITLGSEVCEFFSNSFIVRYFYFGTDSKTINEILYNISFM
ncbi:hypothetical protein LEP1GSC186_4018 [Leptospira noguchii serovar Autumnalis str. ZUN142]|uniref:Uncharacterized protein n=1 Tax=Leptospira noguchii serovar Autumnalis str. ZUN142 TaxID=1085540 RepID=M6U5Q6_9LEPT|nr:hypothetical protein LEP1GSC186_4018 [Leptospira noguchii serovar Autumnalis str. ZUN142]